MAPAQTLTTLASFTFNNGGEPYYGSLVRGSNGSFYGTTFTGGDDFLGTVFEITPSGTLTTLDSFTGDGAYPYGGLILGANENFYGTTSGYPSEGYGTVFEMTPSGTLSTVYSFCSQASCADGIAPYAGLVLGKDGNFYGTTYQGGTKGRGTVFKLTPVGKLTTLYNFCSKANCADGDLVISPLMQATNGNFYGTADAGGAYGWGAVFEITPAGEFNTLHSFDYNDGGYPVGGLVQASDGNLYGTAETGGLRGQGTAFGITTSGQLTTIHNFCAKAYCSDGISPYGTLIQGSNGSLYGTTTNGGTYHYGTVFEMTTTGVVTTLHSFDLTDGASPYAGVVQASKGTLYGTTLSGGSSGENSIGTVFSLTLPATKGTADEPEQH